MKTTTEENSFIIITDHEEMTGKPIYQTVIDARICAEIEEERDDLKREIEQLRSLHPSSGMERELNSSTCVPPVIYDAAIIAWNWMAMNNTTHLGPITSRAYTSELEATIKGLTECPKKFDLDKLEEAVKTLTQNPAQPDYSQLRFAWGDGSWERITP